MAVIRVNICVPEELREAMRKHAEDHPEVNWSEIACQAIADHCKVRFPHSVEFRLRRIEQHLGIEER